MPYAPFGFNPVGAAQNFWEDLKAKAQARAEEYRTKSAGDLALETLGQTAKYGGPLLAGPALGLAGRALTMAPRATALGLGGAALATPTAAGDTTTAGPPQDYQGPGLLRELIGALPGQTHAADADKPMTQDEYKRANRQLKPKSEDDFISDQVAQIRQNPRYLEQGNKGRENMEATARNTAKEAYAGYQRSVNEEDTRLNKDYQAYRTGWETQRTEYLSKPFVERHPTAAQVMTWGGPIAAALLTRGRFRSMNELGEDIVAAGETARKAGNMPELAHQITRAQEYGGTFGAANRGKALAATEAALLPAELRMGADIADKKTLPPTAPAAIAASQRMAKFPDYELGMGLDVFSGMVGAGTGGLLAGKAPNIDLNTLRRYAGGVPPETTPQDLTGILRRRAMANAGLPPVPQPPQVPVGPMGPVGPGGLGPGGPGPVMPQVGGGGSPQGPLPPGGPAGPGAPLGMAGPMLPAAAAPNQLQLPLPPSASNINAPKRAPIRTVTKDGKVIWQDPDDNMRIVSPPKP